jgi:hypothetical protein
LEEIRGNGVGTSKELKLDESDALIYCCSKINTAPRKILKDKHSVSNCCEH